MRLAKILAAAGLLASFTASADQSYSFTNYVNSTIPDANPTGLSSDIVLSNLVGTISNVDVFLNTTNGFTGDLYAFLSFDGGGFAVLLNRPGKTSGNPFGYDDYGLSIDLTDWAATDVHLYGGNSGNPLLGDWQPDGRETDPQLTLDTDPRTAFLSSFDDLDPNGTWTLFIADFATGSESTLVGWTLDIQTIPEPRTLALAFVGTITWFIFISRRRRH